MCGSGCHGAAEGLCALSDRLKAPLIHSVKGKDIMPYDDLRWMGGIGMIGTRAVYNAIMQCDLLLMVGTDYPFSNFLPTGGNVIQIDDRPQALGRRAPTALGAVGSAKPTLKLLLERVAPKNDTAFFDKVTTERRKWDEMLVLLLQGARYSLRKRPPSAHAPDPEEGNHQASWRQQPAAAGPLRRLRARSRGPRHRLRPHLHAPQAHQRLHRPGRSGAGRRSISEISSSVAPNAASQSIAPLAQREGGPTSGSVAVRLKFRREKFSPATDSVARPSGLAETMQRI